MSLDPGAMQAPIVGFFLHDLFPPRMESESD